MTLYKSNTLEMKITTTTTTMPDNITVYSVTWTNAAATAATTSA